MVRNTLYLILSSSVQAALGFAFWIIAARLFSAADIGKAGSLISAATFIAFAALLGLNSTLVRYMPTSIDPDTLLTAGLLVVAASGAGIGFLYVIATPLIAPRLAFILHNPMLALGFVLLTAAAAVNLLTDSIFVGSRKSGYNILTDGGIGSTTKIGLCAILIGTGSYGIFCSSVGGSAAAALASIVLMSTALHWRPSFRKSFRALRPLLRFSAANYVGNILDMLPSLVVPLIVLDRLGAHAAAYYFVAFQVATILYAAVSAVVQTFLAEGSHAEEDWQELLRRSRRLLMALCLPACLIIVIAAHWLLLAFGSSYSEYGTPSLIILAVATLPIAVNNWLWTVLRLSGQLRAIVLSGVVYATTICGLAWFLAPHGLTVLTAAWPVGSLLSAAAALPRKASQRRRRNTRPRHRRPI